MKQIDIIKTYAQKRCLVVDDLPDARAQLKRILIDFGANEIDTAANAQDAIDCCGKHQYDIVIADYNLGAGKSGQQLLEELRFHRLLRNTALFVMVTAENAAHYVLHTLEYEPDDFFNKPISRESLRPRLDQALLKNEYLRKIKLALDDHDLNRATLQAEKLKDEAHRFQNDVRKLLAELYLKSGRAEDTLALCSEYPDDKRPLWVDLAKARALYQLKNFDEAETLLRNIAQSNAYCVEAHDLLAQIYEESHRPLQSQHALLNAVKISPRHAPRQRELGRVSNKIDDHNSSVHAYRSAIRHSKNSCHESASDLLNLALNLNQLSTKVDKAQAHALQEEARQNLDAAEKKYGKHPLVKMRRLLIESDLLAAQNKPDEAEAQTRKAINLHESMRTSVIGNSDAQLSIDCALAFINRGRYDEGESILQALAKQNSDHELAIKIDRLLREPQTREGIAFAAKLNKSGIELYEQGKLEAAVGYFRQVLQEIPNHIGLNLNLIQALSSKAKRLPLNRAEIELLRSCFKRIGDLSNKDSYRDRYEFLLRRFEKIVEDFERRQTEAET